MTSARPSRPAADRGGGHRLADRGPGRRAPLQRGDRGHHPRPGGIRAGHDHLGRRGGLRERPVDLAHGPHDGLAGRRVHRPGSPSRMPSAGAASASRATAAAAPQIAGRATTRRTSAAHSRDGAGGAGGGARFRPPVQPGRGRRTAGPGHGRTRPPTVAALAERTEGWAVGLQLAALSLRSQPDVARFVAAFTGSHRYILDYLGEEILERQRPELRDFLLETSVLERLNGPLCDAVTGRDDSQELLEEVERSGLFVVQLDEVRGWWRYHHLFADLLRARLEQDPERARRLHRNAATWYEQRGLPDDTIRHALAAGEQEWAARLVEENFDTVFNLRGEQATIQSLAARTVRRRGALPPPVAAGAGADGQHARRPRGMEPLLDAAEQVIEAATAEPFAPAAGAEGSLLVNARAMLALQRSYAAQLRGDAEATAAGPGKPRSFSARTELGLSSAVQGFLAMADWLRGRLAAAEEIFESGIGWWRQQGQVTTTAWGFYCLARLQRGQGRLEAAARTGERALAAAGDPGTAPAAGRRARAGRAGRGRLPARRSRPGVGVSAGDNAVPPVRAHPAAGGRAGHAGLDPPGVRRPQGAADAMAEAESFSPGPAGLLNPIPAQRARLLLAQGDVAQAARWTGECGLGPDDPPDYPREPGQLVLARLLLAQDRPDQALVLLDRLDAAAATQGRTGSLVEIRALRALALAALGDDTGATAVLAAALRSGCPEGYVRVFADEGPAMAAVLGRLIAAQRSDQAAPRSR